MLALIFTRKLRPMIIGSDSGWLMLAGMIARPRATSSRTNSGVMTSGIAAPKLWPGCCARARSPGSARQHLLALQVLADRDELHLRRDDAAARVVHLRDVGARLRAARLALQVEAQLGELRVGEALLAVAPRSGRRAARCRRAPRSSARAAAAGPCGCRSSPPGSVYGPEHVVDDDRRVLLARRTTPACRDCAISRIGTRMSGREPCDVDLARSRQRLRRRRRRRARRARRTWSLAFMAALLEVTAARGAEGGCAPRFPAPALSGSGSKGFSHPAARTARPGPLALARPYPERRSRGKRRWQNLRAMMPKLSACPRLPTRLRLPARASARNADLRSRRAPAAAAPPAASGARSRSCSPTSPGSTALSTELDAEEVHRLLARFFELVDGADRRVRRHDRQAHRRRVDGACSARRSPTATTRCARCAPRCGVHAAMETLSAEFGRPLAAHVGVASGEVVAADTGSTVPPQLHGDRRRGQSRRPAHGARRARARR